MHSNLLKTSILSFFVFVGFMSAAQRGSMGNMTITVQNEWLNSYTTLTANANVGATSITVANNALSGAAFSSNLAAGDLILIVQMQGATVDVNTTPTAVWGGNYVVQDSWIAGTNPEWDQTEFGQVLNYNNAGNFEFAEVRAISGGTGIQLNCALTKSYTVSGRVQVIRVPRLDNLTIQNNASVSCPNWNGSTGGVVALEIDGNLTLNGTGRIEANEKGFRGGIRESFSALTGDTGSKGYLGSFDAIEGAEKGESIAGHYAEYDALFTRYCRGAIANGGGGGNYHNAGGGGGSNVGTGVFYGYGVASPGPSNAWVNAWNLENPALLTNPSAGGGRGGYSHATANQNPLTTAPNQNIWSGDRRRYTNGIGGHPLAYNINRAFMGGGGGAGDDNDGDGGNGGRGGGLVFVDVYGTVSGTGSIEANGQNGFNSQGPTPPVGTTQKSGDDGCGGGGGGGSVVLRNINALPASINLRARGGNGGNQQLQLSTFATNTMDGPGGGGAGGLLSFTSGAPFQDVSGGTAGTSNSSIATNFPVNGATGGAAGMTNMTIPFYDLQIDDVTVCGGGSATLTANVLGTLPGGSSINWYTQPYGGIPIHIGASFTTPVLASNTTYYVGVCPGTFRKPVNVLVSPAIVISGTAVIVDETCNGNDGSITGLSASGGFGALSFDWNGVASPSADLNNAVGGSYTLTVTDANGCSETAGPFTIGASPGPSIDITGVSISDETCNGNDGSITGITATGLNITYTWNGVPATDLDLANLAAGSYTLIVTDENLCTSQAGPFNVNLDPGPSIDLTNLVIADETCFGDDGSISGIVVTGNGVTLTWNGNPAGSADLNDISNGTYELVATDGNGCSASSGPLTVNEIPGPSIDDANIAIVDENCNQLDGSITGIVVTGNGLSYDWNGNPSADADLTNAAAGVYSLTVTDNLGCTVVGGPYTIAPTGGPVVDDSNISIQPQTCNLNNGSITGLVVTGTGLTYNWNGAPSTSPDLNGVAANDYVLIIVDANGCTTVYGPVTVPAEPLPTIDDSNLTVVDESCGGQNGSITGLVATGSGIIYSWNGTSNAGADLNGLSAGSYTLQITDANNCSLTYGPVVVGGTTPPVLVVNPLTSVIDAGDQVQITLSIAPSTGNETIVWTPSAGLSCDDCINPIASPTETTIYTVVVTDENGCSSTETLLIEVNNPCGELFVPTIFTPNGDGLHDEICVMGGCIATLDFAVFNRWGERVFQTNDPNECWDGKFRDKEVNTGVFVYKAVGTRDDGTSFKLSGSINVVK
jgi:gliding motility-associated-like protein